MLLLYCRLSPNAAQPCLRRPTLISPPYLYRPQDAPLRCQEHITSLLCIKDQRLAWIVSATWPCLALPPVQLGSALGRGGWCVWALARKPPRRNLLDRLFLSAIRTLATGLVSPRHVLLPIVHRGKTVECCPTRTLWQARSGLVCTKEKALVPMSTYSVTAQIRLPDWLFVGVVAPRYFLRRRDKRNPNDVPQFSVSFQYQCSTPVPHGGFPSAILHCAMLG